MHVHLLLPQSFLGATKEELSGSDQNHIKAKPEVFTTLPFTESSPSPALDVCWMVSTKISNQILLTVFFSKSKKLIDNLRYVYAFIFN